MKKSALYTLFFLSFVISGCGAFWGPVFNPYDDEFKCPYTYEGECVDLSSAYEASLSEADYEIICEGKGRKRHCRRVLKADPGDEAIRGNPARAYYDQKKYTMLSDLIDEENPPILAPAEVIRTLVMPYQSDGSMFSDRFIYLKVKESTFHLPTVEERDDD